HPKRKPKKFALQGQNIRLEGFEVHLTNPGYSTGSLSHCYSASKSFFCRNAHSLRYASFSLILRRYGRHCSAEAIRDSYRGKYCPHQARRVRHTLFPDGGKRHEPDHPPAFRWYPATRFCPGRRTGAANRNGRSTE